MLLMTPAIPTVSSGRPQFLPLIEAPPETVRSTSVKYRGGPAMHRRHIQLRVSTRERTKCAASLCIKHKRTCSSLPCWLRQKCTTQGNSMHRRAYSASRKAPVMQVKANLPKRKPAAALTVSPADYTDRASPRGCIGAPTCRRENGSPLLVPKVGAANAYTPAPERSPPATSAEDSAGSHRCCRSADLADSRATRQTRRYQARRIFGPSQEWCVLSNG